MPAGCVTLAQHPVAMLRARHAARTAPFLVMGTSFARLYSAQVV
jgi:hypothetical protein